MTIPRRQRPSSGRWTDSKSWRWRARFAQKTGDHQKYFEQAPDWTYTPRESDDAMAEQGSARRFMDDIDVVVADATLSWNDGDGIFMIGYLPHKGTLLAYFGPKP